ncbi:uncharacterized protein MAM_01204 [Metarhizium album ARSEF 1941]|uniref:AB hydrolase-1 domain-containing protein n=1 Tax=Metarhizium album (strain ARSEF 1941) TaxID=1081103 RepID=A0A0B2X551_METAS|nr:uncharacterized protein MAM_01204 [Metarhizium album ARSEF 1941]KHO00426.1 hypothetical protein MAM_01204 [Metarhizium album ARSEF 1941]
MVPPSERGPGEEEVPHVRTYFYAGGEYVEDGKGNHFLHNQMYVEKLVPARGVTQAWPIVLMHGNCMTGANFLNKPDGGRGWASNFLEQGYEVYIPDQPLRARSAWHPGDGVPSPAAYPAELLQDRFTAPRVSRQWPQAARHTQWPGTGMMGDAVFDALYASTVQFVSNEACQQAAAQRAGAALLDRIGRPAVLLGHSQAGAYPPLIADARPHLVRSMVLLEPRGPPFQEAVFSRRRSKLWGIWDTPMTYEPAVGDPDRDLVKVTHAPVSPGLAERVLQAEDPPPRKLKNLVHKPMLVVTAEASYHAVYDYCTVEFLRQAGCDKVEHLELAGIGILGNGHMMFLEKNSGEIQGAVEQWIQKAVK